MNLKDDWKIVLELSCDYTNYVMVDDKIAANNKKKDLILFLKKARRFHGDVPIILATLADYTSNMTKKLSLLSNAFKQNAEISNYNEALSCANSALRASIEKKRVPDISYWMGIVREYCVLADDLNEISEADELLQEIEK